MQPQHGQPVIGGQAVQYAPSQQVVSGQSGQQYVATQPGQQYVTVQPGQQYVAAQQMGGVMVVQGQQKSKLAAGLLGILIGALGIHNFYLGYTGKGIAQLLISVLSFGLLAFIPAIWGLIEGILILTGSINVDANGIPLTD